MSCELLLPFEQILILIQLGMVTGGEGFSRGAIQQVSRHPGELQELARTAVAAIRHFRQVQEPLSVLQEIARGLQLRFQVTGGRLQGFDPSHLCPVPYSLY